MESDSKRRHSDHRLYLHNCPCCFHCCAVAAKEQSHHWLNNEFPPCSSCLSSSPSPSVLGNWDNSWHLPPSISATNKSRDSLREYAHLPNKSHAWTAFFQRKYEQTRVGRDWSKARENLESGQLVDDVVWMLKKERIQFGSKDRSKGSHGSTTVNSSSDRFLYV